LGATGAAIAVACYLVRFLAGAVAADWVAHSGQVAGIAALAAAVACSGRIDHPVAVVG